MQTPVDSKRPLYFTLVVAFLYCLWLGAHWLPLDYSDKELAAFVSRVWDIKRELAEHHHLAWWTPNYMSGSSYGLNHSQGFYLLPWLLLSAFTTLQAAGKLLTLGAIFASAVAMYFCARHFLRNGWGAALAALAFMLHPQQLLRGLDSEHVGVIVSIPFVPLTWLFFARTLESGRFRDLFWCAVAVVGMMWTHNKQAFVQFVFLACYLGYWLWPVERRKQWAAAARSCALIGAVSLALGAFFVVPGLLEAKHVKLFYGDPLEAWQRTYAFKSVVGFVDRNGSATRDAMQGVSAKLQVNGYRPHSEQEAGQLRAQITRVFALPTDAPEKYVGIVLLAVLGLTALFNRQRVDRWLFWFFVAMLLAGVMLATGSSNLWSANWTTLSALFGLDGVPQSTRLVALGAVVAAVVFLVLFYRRKLTTKRKKIIAGTALAVFLFVPAFKILTMVPFFKEIRAPFVFYDVPGTFFAALLAGFFVTDVLGGGLGPARPTNDSAGRGGPPRRVLVAVTVIAVLLLVDYWPYQKAAKDNGVPAHTLQNLQATYGAFRQDADWVKTYSVSGRYFHLLGPMYGGKPQVYEAFYNWMCPLGTGLLNQIGLSGGVETHRVFLNLMGARYVVFDKSDPNNAQSGMQQLHAAYRQMFPVALENEDFAVFRNDTAHPYVTGYARACAYVGDVRNTPQLALALAARNWPLVHRATVEEAGRFTQTYREGYPASPPVGDGEIVPLSDVQFTRENSQLVRIKLTAPNACLAVIAESYYPFWRAEVDGKSAEVLRVSTGLMGLELAPGTHEIVLRYEPPRAYALAGIVSVAALLGCIVALVWRVRGSA